MSFVPTIGQAVPCPRCYRPIMRVLPLHAEALPAELMLTPPVCAICYTKALDEIEPDELVSLWNKHRNNAYHFLLAKGIACG